jgi:bifunctional non-homologous end joining protein LigD
MGERLGEYERKRDFSRTPEPRGEAEGSGRAYVIHKHAASRLHYDLRLEHDGVLMSWAVPKGPSLDTKQRRLAVHVEDHPVEYGRFEGVIPEGEYGAGTVMVWDRGTWRPHDDVDEALDSGKLVFDLEGEKLVGRFALIHTGARKGGSDERQWLLIKERDEYVRPADEYDVTAAQTLSTATGRTMEQIAAGLPADLPRQARPAELESQPAPQLASNADRAPAGNGWVHEIKHDGYRLMLVRDGEHAKVLTREGADWSDRFPPLVQAVLDLPANSAIVDCEAIVPGEHGISDFGALQEALAARDAERVYAYCFDLPYLDGHDLSDVPLLERKRLLERLIASAGASRLRFSEHLEGDRERILSHACSLGAEGIVSKRADSPYRPGRSRTWLKSKCVRRQEFVVLGYLPADDEHRGFRALLLGYHDADGALAYAGRVGGGFSEKTRELVTSRLEDVRSDTAPLPSDPPDADGAVWVEPTIVVEARFAEWTRSGRLRQPSFVGVREDVPPETVVKEPSPTDETGIVSGSSKPTAGPDLVAGVRITHPDKIMIAEGPSKLALAEYYAAAAPHVLRYLAGRPLTLLRCPDGADGSCFWQRHVEEGLIPGVRAFDAHDREYVTVDDAEGLVGLVQYLTVEFHTWGSSAAEPDVPDVLVFDLDPGPRIDWDDVRAAALVVREILSRHDLSAFVKTSGGKGLHVVTPIEPAAHVKEAAAAAKSLSQQIAAAGPGRLTIDPRKSARESRIFIDWHRNGAGQGTVAPYIPRARIGAPVSTPITWEELRKLSDPRVFDMDAVLARLAHIDDPWAGIRDERGHLPQEPLPGL